LDKKGGHVRSTKKQDMMELLDEKKGNETHYWGGGADLKGTFEKNFCGTFPG